MQLSLAQLKKQVEDAYRDKHKLGVKDRIPVKARKLIHGEAQRLYRLQTTVEDTSNPIQCPKCDSHRVHTLPGNKKRRCDACGYEGKKNTFI